MADHPTIIRFDTFSGSTYTIDVGDGVIHRSHPSGNSLKDRHGVVIPGTGWKMDNVVGLLTPVGFIALKPELNIGLIMPQGASIPVVGQDEPIVTTGVKDIEVQA